MEKEKENRKNMVKKNCGFVDSEFVETCHEHVKSLEIMQKLSDWDLETNQS